MKHSIVTSIAVVALLTVASPARANVPDLIPVQGMLTNAAGEVVNGNVDVHFALYDSDIAEAPLWDEPYNGTNQVYVDAGFFTVYLGTLRSLPLDVIIGADELWLGISVGEDAEMDRVRLASVPFAIEAQFCRQIGDLEADDIQPRVNIGGDTSAGACGAGQVIQAIDPVTGAISCVTDQTSSSSGGEIVSVDAKTPLVATDDGAGHVTLTAMVGTSAEDLAAGDHTHSGEYIPFMTCTVNYVLKYTASGWTCAADVDTNTTYSVAASSGLTLSGTTIGTDSTIQKRTTAPTCSTGSFLRSIAADGTPTCATDADTNTTYGVAANSGLTISGTTIGTDSTIQKRNTAPTCSAGSYIRSIAADGTPTCATDTNSTYAAGAGLSLSGSTFSLSSSGCVAGEVWKWTGSAWACVPSTSTVTIVSSGPSISAGSFGISYGACPSSHPVVVSCGIDLSNVLTMAVTSVAPRFGITRAYQTADGTYTTTANGCQASARNDGTSTANPGFKMVMTCRE